MQTTHFVLLFDLVVMASSRWDTVLVIFFVLLGSWQRYLAVSQQLAALRRPLIVMPNLEEQLRVHFNVSSVDLAPTFVSRQHEAHVLLRQLLEHYELTHVSTGVTVYFGGFSTVGSDKIVCPEHNKTLSKEYYEAGSPLKYPSLNCAIYQEVSCVMFERARKTFYVPLEKIRLTRKFYVGDDDRHTIRACEELSPINSINMQELFARRAKATASPTPPPLISGSATENSTD